MNPPTPSEVAWRDREPIARAPRGPLQSVLPSEISYAPIVIGHKVSSVMCIRRPLTPGQPIEVPASRVELSVGEGMNLVCCLREEDAIKLAMSLFPAAFVALHTANNSLFDQHISEDAAHKIEAVAQRIKEATS